MDYGKLIVHFSKIKKVNEDSRISPQQLMPTHFEVLLKESFIWRQRVILFPLRQFAVLVELRLFATPPVLQFAIMTTVQKKQIYKNAASWTELRKVTLIQEEKTIPTYSMMG